MADDLEAGVERQYKDGVHVGSGLPQSSCPCGFCVKHRHGFNQGDGSVSPMTATVPAFVWETTHPAVCVPITKDKAVADGWRDQGWPVIEYAAEGLQAGVNRLTPTKLKDWAWMVRRHAAALAEKMSPRHPAVVYWRDDAIRACAKIAHDYGQSYPMADMLALLSNRSA